MAGTIAELMAALTPDRWRLESGFSPEVGESQEEMFAASSDTQIESILSRWLSKYQPCLFGRLAAKNSGIVYCILRDANLVGSDQSIKATIQRRRFHWSREAFRGGPSAFIVLAVSRRIAEAEPNQVAAELARRLAFLYLRQEIEMDKAYLDEICLEVPGRDPVLYKWPTGVNYFCAHGDRRWWQDHRIPGGCAFSVNSVGHLVKSGRVLIGLDQLAEALGDTTGEGRRPPIDSLPKALEFAMRTIALSSNAVSGNATRLLPLPADSLALAVPKCPVALPPFLADKNHCEYEGLYHTDVTLPAEYFRSDVERPRDLPSHRLDFTYLFQDDVDNADYDTMGEGRRIRDFASGFGPSPLRKADRGHAVVCTIQDTTLLREALSALGG